MDRDMAPPFGLPHLVYMVEAYRSNGHATEPPRAPTIPARTEVLGVIDVPGDELALFLIAAPDEATAERVVRERGMRPIRVVPVQWDGLRLRPT